jgi:hypothetical protein
MKPSRELLTGAPHGNSLLRNLRLLNIIQNLLGLPSALKMRSTRRAAMVSRSCFRKERSDSAKGEGARGIAQGGWVGGRCGVGAGGGEHRQRRQGGHPEADVCCACFHPERSRCGTSCQ